MNRGSLASSGGPARTRIRFNEAPIHESGKFGSCGASSTDFHGFNEAPIHESGKSHALLGVG